jgi:hypothetical protein
MSETTQTIMLAMVLVIGLLLTSLFLDSNVMTGHMVKDVEVSTSKSTCGLLELRIGDSCCADLNENEICDKHELEPKGFCPDLNNDGVCDNKEPEVEVIKPFEVNKNSAQASRNGFTIALDAFEYELYEDWGKITRVNFTLVNNGDHIISPIVLFDVYDLNYNGAYRSPYVKVETTLAPGEFIVMPAYVDVSFTNLDKPKIIELGLKNSAAWPYTPVATLQKHWTP